VTDPGSVLYVAYTQPLEWVNGATEVLDPVATIKLSYLTSL